MKLFHSKPAITLLCLLSMSVSAQQRSPVKERFAGLHFDFHAVMTDSGIGRTFTPEMIDSFLTIVKPDFIQVDCKGHEGVSSYPTKAGQAAPAIEKDILKIWREVTAKHNVPLYVHYSGIWDSQALVHHPEWARHNAEGKPDKKANSLFSAYEDELLIPQIKELATVYKLDGIWVDGDCWALSPDYSPAAIAAFTKETGITQIPYKEEDPFYFEWSEFHRKAFRNYITRYANAAHAVAPDFKVTSNWSFSSMMPEKVDVPIDYLSGDVAGSNSLYSSAFESRNLALQGKPWDLMSWSFAWKNNSKATKSVPQLQQEAAEVLAMGGGFQTYWQQNRDGTPEPYQFRKMAEIIKFCNERKAYTYKNTIVPQIGLLYCTYAWRRINTGGLYSSHNQEAMKGVLNILMDSQLPVEIIMDHQLRERINNYPLLIIPQWEHIDPNQRTLLLEYVQQGGKLIVIGTDGTRDFREALGVTTAVAPQRNAALYAGLGERIVMMHADFQAVKVVEELTTTGVQLTADDWRFTTSNPLATVRQYGKGKIGGIYIDIGAFYNNNQNAFLPELMQAVIQSMNPALISVVTGSSTIHQVVSRNHNKLQVHLINAGGPHNNPTVLTYESIPPVEKITVKVKLQKAPAGIRLQPGNIKPAFVYKKGTATVSIPKLNIYSIVEIEE